MSQSLDVNVLLYASDRDSPFHEAARRVIEELSRGTELTFVAWVTVLSYLRMATHPGIFRRPLLMNEAAANMTAFLSLPSVRVLSEADDFWQVFLSVIGEVPVRGNLVPDAHLVAILRQHGIRRVVTGDRDFLKFRNVDVIDPFGA